MKFLYKESNDILDEYEIYVVKNGIEEIFCHLSSTDLDIFIDICNVEVNQYE